MASTLRASAGLLATLAAFAAANAIIVSAARAASFAGDSAANHSRLFWRLAMIA